MAIQTGELSAFAQPHQSAADGVWATAMLIGLFLLWLALGVWSQWRNGRGRDDSGGDDGSGGPPRPEPPPAPEGPAWWPEFEREFAAYVVAGGDHGQERERPPCVERAFSSSRE